MPIQPQVYSTIKDITGSRPYTRDKKSPRFFKTVAFSERRKLRREDVTPLIHRLRYRI